MPPHCDSLDGPVVTAARAAIGAGDVDVVLPFVHPEGEDEVRAVFDLTMRARQQGAWLGDLSERELVGPPRTRAGPRRPAGRGGRPSDAT